MAKLPKEVENACFNFDLDLGTFETTKQLELYKRQECLMAILKTFIRELFEYDADIASHQQFSHHLQQWKRLRTETEIHQVSQAIEKCTEYAYQIDLFSGNADDAAELREIKEHWAACSEVLHELFPIKTKSSQN